MYTNAIIEVQELFSKMRFDDNNNHTDSNNNDNDTDTNNNNEYIAYVEYNGIYDIESQNSIKLLNNNIKNEKINLLYREKNNIKYCIFFTSIVCIIVIIIIVIYKN